MGGSAVASFCSRERETQNSEREKARDREERLEVAGSVLTNAVDAAKSAIARVIVRQRRASK